MSGQMKIGRRMRKLLGVFLLMINVCLLAGCFSKPANEHESTILTNAQLDSLTEHQLDSLSFQSKHHFTTNYNFIINSDSIILLTQQPEEMMSNLMVDSFAVYKNDNVVVADIRIMPSDTIDSVWIQLAKDQETFGWIHETEMLTKVVPDDPISQFISAFSDIHLLIFLIFTIFILSIYFIRKLRKENVPIVHFNDIDTFYPTLLCIVVALSATLYATLQLFAPDMWRHFYYHPTLNPFSVPLLLSIFLLSVWAIIIVLIATVDDVRHHLTFGDAFLYLGGVGTMCAINYVVFSLTTLYYVGYPLLLVYSLLAIYRFWRHSYTSYVCGNCGAKMRHKGRCTNCGVMNE